MDLPSLISGIAVGSIAAWLLVKFRLATDQAQISSLVRICIDLRDEAFHLRDELAEIEKELRHVTPRSLERVRVECSGLIQAIAARSHGHR